MDNEQSLKLYNRIIEKINKEDRLMVIKRKIIINFIFFIVILAFFVPILMKLYQDLVQSGFIQFISLFFSDFSIIMSNFNDFVWTILESVPAVSSALTFTLLIMSIYSFGKICNNWQEIKNIQHSKLLTA